MGAETRRSSLPQSRITRRVAPDSRRSITSAPAQPAGEAAVGSPDLCRRRTSGPRAPSAVDSAPRDPRECTGPAGGRRWHVHGEHRGVLACGVLEFRARGVGSERNGATRRHVHCGIAIPTSCRGMSRPVLSGARTPARTARSPGSRSASTASTGSPARRSSLGVRAVGCRFSASGASGSATP